MSAIGLSIVKAKSHFLLNMYIPQKITPADIQRLAVM